MKTSNLKVNVSLRLGVIPRIFGSCQGCGAKEDHRADQVSFSGFDAEFKAEHAACAWVKP